MATVVEEVPVQQIPTRLAVAPFEQWTYEDVAKEMRERLPEDYQVRKSYAVDKDHFRKGLEWVGPGDAKVNEKLQKQFAPEDATGEVLQNVSNAFDEPQIGGAPLEEPPEGQQIPADVTQRIHEATVLLSSWWDKQRLQEHLSERLQTAAAFGVAGLRLWIPWRFLLQNGDAITIKPTAELKEALSYIHVTAPLPDAGAILTDDGTQDKCAVFMDEEVVWINGQKNTYKRAELIFLDPNRQRDEDAETIIRIVYSDPVKKPSLRAVMPLGGHLLFTEMSTPSLLSDPVIRTQRQLNLLCSLVTRLGETAAFRERYIKNAKPQGTRYPYNDGDAVSDGSYLERDNEGNLWMVVPQERTLGANTTTELIGLAQYDEKGDEKGNQMPDIVIADPVDPKPYIEAADASRRRILRMCSQGHLGGISNAEASGIAYEQARAVFEKDLNKRRVAEEGMLRELLTAVLALTEVITNKRGYFTDVIRVTVDQHVDAGPRSPDLVRLDLESYEAGVLSQETTMARVGVEDVNAEVVRVRRSASRILEVLEKAATAGNAFDPDSIIDVLKELNLPPEIIGKLKGVKKPEPAAPKPPATT